MGYLFLNFCFGGHIYRNLTGGLMLVAWIGVLIYGRIPLFGGSRWLGPLNSPLTLLFGGLLAVQVLRFWKHEDITAYKTKIIARIQGWSRITQIHETFTEQMVYRQRLRDIVALACAMIFFTTSGPPSTK